MSERPPPTIRAVALDLDGVMFDTETLYYRVAGEMLTARGKVLTREMVAALIGRPWPAAAQTFKLMAGLTESLDELVIEAGSRFAALLDTAVHPAPGLFALLSHLEHRRIPHAVATSSRREYTERLLRQHHLFDHFAFLLTAEDVARGKPDPEIYRRVAEQFDIAPAALMVFEDSPLGVAAAKAAGAFTVAVPHDQSPAAALAAADLVVPHLDDPAIMNLLS